jgi:hypothetical protein
MRVSGALLLAALAAVARAGDPPQAPGDAIAAAKKDLASIKSAASPTEPGPGLPGLDARDDGQAQGGARPEGPLPLTVSSSAPADPTAKREGTGNWLVDAMERKTGSPQSGLSRDDLARGDLDWLRDAERSDSKPVEEAHTGKSGERAASRDLAASVTNPLDAFMGGWISAHDRGLLLPAKRGDGQAGAGQGGTREETLPGIDFGQQDFLAGGTPASRDADAKPTANPYVGDLDVAAMAPMKPLSLPDTPGFSPFTLPDFSRGSVPSLDPRPIDASKSVVPDFTQAPDDDKYFKQMKRF